MTSAGDVIEFQRPGFADERLGHELHPTYSEAFQNDELFIQQMIETFKHDLEKEQQGLGISQSHQQYHTKLLRA